MNDYKERIKNRGGNYVTQTMHENLRGEIRHDITTVDLSVRALEKKMEAMLLSILAEIQGMNAKIEGMNAKIERTLGLMEEQRAENKTVWDQQEQFADRLDKIEEKYQV